MGDFHDRVESLIQINKFCVKNRGDGVCLHLLVILFAFKLLVASKNTG